MTLLDGYAPSSLTQHAIITTTEGFVGTPSFAGVTPSGLFKWSVDGNSIVLSALPRGTLMVIR